MAKILIVDDERLILEMLSAFVRIMGHEPVDAISSRQARERLAQIQPDVMLLDIMLPDTNGIDLCRELRQEAATAELPIIIISAHAPPKIREAEEAGATAYLSKPVNLQSLRAALSNIGIPEAPRR